MGTRWAKIVNEDKRSSDQQVETRQHVAVHTCHSGCVTRHRIEFRKALEDKNAETGQKDTEPCQRKPVDDENARSDQEDVEAGFIRIELDDSMSAAKTSDTETASQYDEAQSKCLTDGQGVDPHPDNESGEHDDISDAHREPAVDPNENDCQRSA